MRIAIGIVALLSIGCTAHQHVERLRDEATSKTFNAPVARVWSASIDAIQQNGILIDSMDKQNGYIAAHAEKHDDSWGEEIGVWISPTDANATKVDVVSRRIGAAFLYRKNWEEPILSNIAINLQKAGSQ